MTLKDKPKERLEAFRRLQNEGAAMSLRESPGASSPARTRPVDFDRFSSQPNEPKTVHKGGRPKKYLTREDALQGARDRTRAYRAREKDQLVVQPSASTRNR